MTAAWIVSADSDVIEPADVWTARMRGEYASRAPRSVPQPEGGDLFVAEGLNPFPVAGFAVAGVDPKDFAQRMAHGYPGVPPGARDPVERIKDQERDGVQAEVLYPSLAMRLLKLKDGGLRVASFKAYNDWLAEYCAQNPTRLVGVALIALDGVADGIAEVERAARIGLRGAMIWGAPPAERPYSGAEYDSF